MGAIATQSPATTAKTGRKILVMAAVATLLGAMGTWMLTTQDPSAERVRRSLSSDAFAEATGVRIVRAALTAGGGMIDLQYQVVHPDKSLIVHDAKQPPAIVDDASGRTVNWSYHEHTHDRELHTAVKYHDLLMNPDGAFERGHEVTVVIGDARLEGLVVE